VDSTGYTFTDRLWKLGSCSINDPECEACGLHIGLSSKSYQSKDGEKKLLHVEGIRFYFYCAQYCCVMLAQ